MIIQILYYKIDEKAQFKAEFIRLFRNADKL